MMSKNSKTKALDFIQALMFIEGISLDEIAQRVSKQGDMARAIREVLEKGENDGTN